MSRERPDAVERELLARRSGGGPASRSDARLSEALPAQAGLLLSLQQSVGNRAVSRLVQRRRGSMTDRRPAQRAAASGVVLQAKNDDDSDYTNAEKREAREHAAEEFAGRKKVNTKTVAAAMAKYLLDTYPPIATNYKNKAALEKACLEWWNRPSLIEEAVAVEARHPLVDPTLEYDDVHGDLHFIDTPTKTKSAWLLGKAAANELCEDTIRQHFGPLGVHSAGRDNPEGWSAFYITASHDTHIGSYSGAKKQGKFPTTDHFSIQLQVNYNENIISYHGFPDERIEGHPLGCSINKTDRTKLV